jgi:hypothetical protein
MDIDRWLLQTAAFLLCGAYFFITGRWPRRQGTDPHCRKCEYDLAQRTSDRCPECGTLLVGSAVVVGRRTRVAWRIWGAAVCAVLAVGGTVWLASGPLRLGGLNAWLPTTWLLQDAARARPSRAVSALQELARRVTAEALTADELRELADACLAIRADEFAPTEERSPADFLLGWFARSGHFTDAQWQRFADLYFDRTVAIPPIVPVDSISTVWVTPGWARLPVFGELTWRSLTYDGQDVAVLPTATSQSAPQNRALELGLDSNLRANLPSRPERGTYAVSLTFDLALYRIESSSMELGDPLHTSTYTHHATVRVVAAEDYRRAVVAALEDSLRVADIVELSRGGMLAVAVEPVRPMPCSVHLKVSLEGRAVKKSGWMPIGFCERRWFHLPGPQKRPEKVTVIIELQTHDLYSSDGEANARLQLRFPDLKITRRAP